MTPICQMKDLPLGGSTTCRRESLEPSIYLQSIGKPHKSPTKYRSELARCLINIGIPYHLILLTHSVTLSSDHLPIHIILQMKTPSHPGLRRIYVNLKKENWDRYRQEVEAALSMGSIPTDCQRDEKIFHTVLLKASSQYIPTLRHRLHVEPVPSEILDMIYRRDALRKRDPTSPELPSCGELLKELMAKQCIKQRTKHLPSMESRSQHIKAGQTHFFKQDPNSDKGDKEEAPGDCTDMHH